MVQKRNNLELDIIGLLIKKENHVRGIAKELNESHTTVSRKLNSLIKENVLDFRREGRNKIFFLKRNLIAKTYFSEAELNKRASLMKKHPKLIIIFEEILKSIKEPLIILFGSYAKGTEKLGSDIDIYVETKNRAIKKSVESINSGISVKIGPFDKASPLIKEIIKEHVVLRGVEAFYEQISE